jgi:Na+/glutamate symporter
LLLSVVVVVVVVVVLIVVVWRINLPNYNWPKIHLSKNRKGL